MNSQANLSIRAYFTTGPEYKEIPDKSKLSRLISQENQEDHWWQNNVF
jgi:hypothetical protein